MSLEELKKAVSKAKEASLTSGMSLEELKKAVLKLKAKKETRQRRLFSREKQVKYMSYTDGDGRQVVTLLVGLSGALPRVSLGVVGVAEESNEDYKRYRYIYDRVLELLGCKSLEAAIQRGLVKHKVGKEGLFLSFRSS